MVNFLAELSRETLSKLKPTPMPTNVTIDDVTININKGYGLIYEIDIRPTPPVLKSNETSYWDTLWGGTYDNYRGTYIELYYSQYLSRVNSVTELTDDTYRYYISNNRIVYMYLPRPFWFYEDWEQTYRVEEPILHSALNPDSPSNNKINEKIVPVRLETPDFSVKLSDNYNGVILNQGFNISLYNNDGMFDSDDYWNLFNSPVTIKKSTKTPSTYSDFKEIRRGRIENIRSSFDKYDLSVNDDLASLSNPVNELLEMKNELNIDEKYITDYNDMVAKPVPILYGTKTFELKLEKGTTNGTPVYILPEGTSSINKVFDKDKNELSSSSYIYNLSNSTLTSSTVKYVKATGYINNNIGYIIRDIITRKAKISYTATFWNVNETNLYIISPSASSILIENGTIKNAIDSVLKNDMAYLIQQNDGRLTIRKYGETYKTHEIQVEMLTKKPERNFDKVQENYLSSVILNYHPDNNSASGFYKDRLLYDNDRQTAIKNYRKEVIKEFDVNLYGLNMANNLARRLSARYSKLRERIKISVGYDTSDIELLDTVKIELNINGREYSKVKNFYVVEINPAQDTLVLEEIN